MYKRIDTVILDIQFLLGKDRNYIAKEISILHADGMTPKHFLIKPPYSLNVLDSKIRRQNDYNLRNINGLCWNSGNEDFLYVKCLLSTFLKSKIVIVKGCEKKTFMMKHFPSLIIKDIGEVFKLDKQMDYTHNCSFHHHLKSKRCAINNVFKIHSWIEKEGLFYDSSAITLND